MRFQFCGSTFMKHSSFPTTLLEKCMSARARSEASGMQMTKICKQDKMQTPIGRHDCVQSSRAALSSYAQWRAKDEMMPMCRTEPGPNEGSPGLPCASRPSPCSEACILGDGNLLSPSLAGSGMAVGGARLERANGDGDRFVFNFVVPLS